MPQTSAAPAPAPYPLMLRVATWQLDLVPARLEQLGFMLDDIGQEVDAGLFSQWLGLGPVLLELCTPALRADGDAALRAFLEEGPGLMRMAAVLRRAPTSDAPPEFRVRELATGERWQIALQPLGIRLPGDVALDRLQQPLAVPLPAHGNGVTGAVRLAIVADNPLGQTTRLAARLRVDEISIGHDQAEIQIGDLAVRFASPILTARRYRDMDLGDRLFGGKVLTCESRDLALTAQAFGGALHRASEPGQRLLVDLTRDLGLILEVLPPG